MMPEQSVIEIKFSGATLEISFAPRVISIIPQTNPWLYSGFILKKDKTLEIRLIIGVNRLVKIKQSVITKKIVTSAPTVKIVEIALETLFEISES